MIKNVELFRYYLYTEKNGLNRINFRFFQLSFKLKTKIIPNESGAYGCRN